MIGDDFDEEDVSLTGSGANVDLVNKLKRKKERKRKIQHGILIAWCRTISLLC